MRSPVALSCLRSDHRTSPPCAKSFPIQHQDLIAELKNTATPPQDDEAVPKYAAPTKMRWVPSATYHVPLPSPEDNWVYADEDDDTSDLPLMDMKVKWYDSDEDSYSSQCPKDKKYSCKSPPTNRLERKFHHFFEGRQKGVPGQCTKCKWTSKKNITFLFVQDALPI